MDDRVIKIWKNYSETYNLWSIMNYEQSEMSSEIVDEQAGWVSSNTRAW